MYKQSLSKNIDFNLLIFDDIDNLRDLHPSLKKNPTGTISEFY